MFGHSDLGSGARTGSRYAMAAFTLTRLLLVPGIALAFMHSALLTSCLLVAFMVADLGDGVIARRLGVEDVTRRALDSVVDRIAIDSCLLAAMLAGAMPVPIGAALLLRDAYCGLLCARMVHRVGIAIKADIAYRALNGSVAAWALAAPFVGDAVRAWLALGILVAAIVVAVDLTRCVTSVSRTGAVGRGAVVPASVARRMRDAANSRIAPSQPVLTGALSTAR